LGLLAAIKGYRVTAIDLQPVKWLYRHPALLFVQGNIFELDFSAEQFDLIINCSTIEHVGLSKRFGVKESRPDADIEAMALLKKLLKPGKVMILTIPVGQDRVFSPLHRVYGRKRLPRLLNGWKVVKKGHWVKDDLNRWFETEESEALDIEPKAHYYGLGLFLLQC
jgi:SAM-dependent methyltransferase